MKVIVTERAPQVVCAPRFFSFFAFALIYSTAAGNHCMPANDTSVPKQHEHGHTLIASPGFEGSGLGECPGKWFGGVPGEVVWGSARGSGLGECPG